jgi:molybdopterin synthase catalytic subunit
MTVRVLLFAYLRERCGCRELVLELPEGATVGDCWTRLRERFPRLVDQRLRFALDHVYVDNSAILHDNAELALIPPVSGGIGGAEGAAVFRITEDPIDTASLMAAVTDPTAGGVVLFVGTTRDRNEGRAVARLEYEAYREMAVAEMARIGDELRRRWPVVRVAMVHRIGVVPIGEASVAIAVSAGHRDEAFAACRHGIDALKESVPIWKKEYYEDGHRWIGACTHDPVPGREVTG